MDCQSDRILCLSIVIDLRLDSTIPIRSVKRTYVKADEVDAMFFHGSGWAKGQEGRDIPRVATRTTDDALGRF